MPETPNIIDIRIRQLEDELGISGVSSPAKNPVTLPVGLIVITATSSTPFAYGTWTLLDSGNLLGGQIGMVYAWKRTA